MNSLRNDERDDDLEDPRGHRDREITLGTTMVLGIFFGLAILCAVFFGFGYSIGAKHNAATSSVAPAIDTGSLALAGGSKPAPGMPGTAVPVAKLPATEKVFVPVEAPEEQAPLRVATKPPVAAPESAPVKTVAPAPKAAAPVVPAAVPVLGQTVVQVAAVSHQEDADLLVSTLKKKNYNVSIHTEPQDKLLHVQIGPFANHKDADVMRLKLQADGFNAIVKDSAK